MGTQGGWSEKEVRAAVSAYFGLLEAERAGTHVNKADLYRRSRPSRGNGLQYKKGERVRHPSMESWGLVEVLESAAEGLVRICF